MANDVMLTTKFTTKKVDKPYKKTNRNLIFNKNAVNKPYRKKNTK